jgi:hypothetical protein
VNVSTKMEKEVLKIYYKLLSNVKKLVPTNAAMDKFIYASMHTLNIALKNKILKILL